MIIITEIICHRNVSGSGRLAAHEFSLEESGLELEAEARGNFVDDEFK